VSEDGETDQACEGVLVAEQAPPPADSSAVQSCEPRPVWRDRLIAALRHLAPICAAIALVLVQAGDAGELDEDLQLVVPHSLPSDAELIPVRALLYTHLRSPEGPALSGAPVAVRVETLQGDVLGRAQLVRSSTELSDLEGSLHIAAGQRHGLLRVVAEVARSSRRLLAHAYVDMGGEPVQLQARALRSLQQFSAGAVHAEPEATPPAGMAVQVRGGACVPEQICPIAALIGEPAAALRVLGSAALTPSPQAERDLAETSGVVEFRVTPHGPESELRLQAYRAGRRVASRDIRLPMALSALAVKTDADVVEPGAVVQVQGDAADGGCLVDAFQDGYWVATGSLSRCAEPSPLPFALRPGVTRLQLRRDALSNDSASAAVRVVYVRDHGETGEQIVSSLARAALDFAPEDAFARACVQAPGTCQDRAAHAYLFALLEAGIAPLPQPVSGYAHTLAQRRQRLDRMRVLALCALGCGGLGLALSIGQRGLTASARSRRILTPDVELRWYAPARLRAVGVVLASAGGMLLVFVVLALYVLARGGY